MKPIALEDLKIASPCSASWDAMSGDERKRFCDQCSLHVYDLSGLTRPEAETLITESEGSVCVRMHRRADGTVISKDCPVGLATKVKRKLRGAAAAFIALTTLGGCFSKSDAGDVPKAPAAPTVEQPAPDEELPHLEMGEIAEPDVPAPTRPKRPVKLMGKIAPMRDHRK